MILVKEFIKQLQQLPDQEAMLTFRIVTNENMDSELMDFASVDGKYILVVKNKYLINPPTTYGVMLYKMEKANE